MRGRTSARGPRGRTVRRTWYTVEHPRRGGAVGRTDLRVRAKSAESALRKVPRRRSGSGNDGRGVETLCCGWSGGIRAGARLPTRPKSTVGCSGAAEPWESTKPAALASGDFKDGHEPRIKSGVTKRGNGARYPTVVPGEGAGGPRDSEPRSARLGNRELPEGTGPRGVWHGRETPAFVGAGPRIKFGAGPGSGPGQVWNLAARAAIAMSDGATTARPRISLRSSGVTRGGLGHADPRTFLLRRLAGATKREVGARCKTPSFRARGVARPARSAIAPDLQARRE